MHDLHTDYPLATEKIEITKEMLSDYQLQIIEDNNIFLGKSKNLIPCLDNERKYKLHHQDLKVYFKLGLQ